MAADSPSPPPHAAPRRRRLTWLVPAVLALLAIAAGCGATKASSSTKSTSTSSRDPSTSSQPQPNGSGPLGKLHLYVDPSSSAALQAAAWRKIGQTANAKAVSRIARQPTATWLTSDQTPRALAAARVDAAARAHQSTVLVLYYIPDRDCHGYSSGGAPSDAAYLAYVSAVAAGIGSHPTIVILEPDAIDQSVSGCVASNLVADRYQLLSKAIGILRAHRSTHVYLDAGNASWVPAQNLVTPLKEAGIDHADGFSVNVANFQSTSASVDYGRSLSSMLGGAHFVIDTSRNGAGPLPGPQSQSSWCNPPGRALGRAPSTSTGIPGLDAYLWVKYPGDSDGTCNGGPPAGVWWPAYALQLVSHAH